MLEAALPGVGCLERRDGWEDVPGKHHLPTTRLTRHREVRGRRHPVMHLDEVDVEPSQRVDAGNRFLGRPDENVWKGYLLAHEVGTRHDHPRTRETSSRNVTL